MDNARITSTTPNHGKSGAKRSWVWDYFTEIAEEGKVECNICKKRFAYKSTTSNMGYHLKENHEQTNSSKKRKTEIFDDYVDGWFVNDMEIDFPSPTGTENVSKIHKRDLHLIRFIIHTNQPIALVESESFIDFCRSLNDSYTLPCRQTVMYSLIPKMVRIQRE